VSKIKVLLGYYAKFLSVSWEILEKFSEKDQSGSMKGDWLQANWEVLIEGALSDLRVVLEPYGEGADCNSYSSRVLYPERVPTHNIICVPAKNKKLYDCLNEIYVTDLCNDIIFVQFVTMGKDGWYYEKPDFEYVLGSYDDKVSVLQFESVEFKLHKLL